MDTRRQRPPALLDDVLDELSVSRSWAFNSLSGSMLHKASGMRVSPTNGIFCAGHEYRLSAQDIEIEGDVPLGAGASGTVWRGTIKTTATPIAIKVLRVENSSERQHLLNEVRTLIESEGCPYLVQWHAGFASQKGQVWLVLELMDCGSLSGLRRPSGLPPRILAAVGLQVLKGLDHLHARKFLHNDIKPGNVLLNTDGSVKLTDFGITRSLQNSICCTCMGTQTYLAPEKMEPENGYSLPSDIWSFGIMMYELASGSHPFASANGSFAAIYQSLIDEPEPRLHEDQGHPSSLCHFVECCLMREPAKRASATELLSHEFLALAASQDELSEWLATRN
mmetsp:Transcript_30952/g.57958  ORF Transcript_30952/g.57958 Transcript_30952/m.57958 type:complete len:337 (-) Transcript_30952:196-1206(-)